MLIQKNRTVLEFRQDLEYFHVIYLFWFWPYWGQVLGCSLLSYLAPLNPPWNSVYWTDSSVSVCSPVRFHANNAAAPSCVARLSTNISVRSTCVSAASSAHSAWSTSSVHVTCAHIWSGITQARGRNSWTPWGDSRPRRRGTYSLDKTGFEHCFTQFV